jgi:hypothetical protein
VAAHFAQRCKLELLALADSLALDNVALSLGSGIFLLGFAKLSAEFEDALLVALLLALLQTVDLRLQAGTQVAAGCKRDLIVAQGLERIACGVELLGSRAGKRPGNEIQPGNAISDYDASTMRIRLGVSRLQLYALSLRSAASPFPHMYSSLLWA